MTFQQTVGEQSIGVQLSGDGNVVTIYAGRASLALSRPQRRKAEPRTELELLRVDIRATTLVGRDADIAALDACLASGRPIALRCLFARAGTGKTRLAVELCERAEKAGWTAGFVQHGPFQDFVKVAAGWRWDKPTLVVVDYAASLARDVRQWLEILAAGNYAGAPKLRILLLERHAETEQGWWADLMRTVTFSGPSPADLADPPAPIALASLGALEDRRALLAETMRCAGAIAGSAEVPRPPAPGENPEFDRRLADDAIDNEPLYLMMAGAEAVQSGAPAALCLTRIDLAERAAIREQGRLARLAAQWGLPDKLLTHLALCVTLQGGCDPEAAVDLLREESQAMSLASPLAPTDTIDRLAEAMPASATKNIDAMRPDLVGEAFVLVTMRAYRNYPKTETGIVERAWARAPSKVAATLVRVAQDVARGNGVHDSVRWLGDIIGRTRDLGELHAVLDAMPHETLALRETAVIATRLTAEAYRALAEQDPDTLRPYLAGSLTNLANRLSAIGQREDALDAAREAVALYHELVAQRPGALRPDLAISLNALANALSDVGQREAALNAAREAVGVYRELVAQRPDAFRPELAGSLNNLANTLSDVGQREAALNAAREAVDVYRTLAARRSDSFRPYLAGSLNNLAKALSDVGQREHALDAAREAVDIRRELAAQRPDAFRPDLAGSLNNLAKALSDVGQREAALDPAREAVDIRRELAAHWPDAFRPHLAVSLNNLANMLSEVGHREAALDAAREAVDVYRALAAQRSDAFRPDLARSLTMQASCLHASDLIEEAVASDVEAIATITPHFLARPMVLADLTITIARQYIEHCEKAGREPDAELLTPIVEALNKLQGDPP